MASYKAFVISGFFLVTLTIAVQSIPIHKAKHIIRLHSKHNKQTNELETSTSTTTISPSTTTTTTTNSQDSLAITDKNDHKKKRYIGDDQFDAFDDSESDEINSYEKSQKNNNINHILHTKIQETSAKIHDNADKPVDTDDSKVFSDIKMTPNELTDVVRRRRDVKLMDESNRRRKRALSPYDFYNADSFYNSYGDLVERSSRSFAPLYWYPSNYERSLRSVLVPSYYQSSEWPSLYSSSIDDNNDDTDDDEIPIYEDENEYESNRYPILLPSSNNPLDNLQLQQEYNTDDLPIDEDFDENNDDDDDDGGEYRLFYQRQNPYYSRYDPYDTLY